MCRDKECCVATGFPGKLGELGRDKDSTITTKMCWPRVATGNVVSRQGWDWAEWLGSRYRCGDPMSRQRYYVSIGLAARQVQFCVAT